MPELSELFAPTPRGTERLLAEELRALGCARVRPLAAGVSFAGTPKDAYRALLWSRIASRVLLTLARVPAATADELYAAVAELPWEEHVRAGGTIAVDAVGTNPELRNTQFTAVRVKDAIADRFVARYGRRPSVDTRDPDVRVNVVIRAEKATVSIDLSGEPLHRRGYREPGVQVEAPMKENLAAAVLAFAGWAEIAAAGGAFVDPMCGSGTLAIEAALLAGDVAPGLTRTRWGFERWLGHDEAAWEAVLGEARERRAAGLAALGGGRVVASDADPRAVEVARACVARAGLREHVAIVRREVGALEAPEAGAGEGARGQASAAPRGLVATNPPYGERIDARGGLPALYAELGCRLREGFGGWRLAVITPDDGLERGLGMQAERRLELYNGRILSPVRVFEVGESVEGADGAPLRSGSSAGALTPPASSPPAESSLRGAPFAPAPASPAVPMDPSTQAFANRLRKMARHYEKWARKAGVSCYRVYDADLPDFALAIDVYAGAAADEGKRWVHVAEYAPPRGIDPERAARRLADATAIAAEVLGVGADDVFVKVRERQRGSAQYGRMARTRVTGTVAEGGLLFEVNLSDYLDTGLFLDHRPTRAWLRELAAEKRFLNLFAYTGTASVYAADGGAVATTTVDMSATYLAWAQRNMALNRFGGSAHRRVREDVLQWLEAAAATPAERFDLVFCDPPTFSNSKRMRETWDVQRDHVALISRIADVLAPGGLVVFSCNRRRFELDVEALGAAGLSASDVTARTIPKDFERRPTVHSCWTIRRTEESGGEQTARIS